MELQLQANYPFKSLPFYKNVPVQRQFAQSVMLPRVFHPARPALSSHLTSSCSADRPPPRQSAGLHLMCVCLESEIKGTLFFCFGFFVGFFVGFFASSHSPWLPEVISTRWWCRHQHLDTTECRQVAVEASADARKLMRLLRR